MALEQSTITHYTENTVRRFHDLFNMQNRESFSSIFLRFSVQTEQWNVRAPLADAAFQTRRYGPYPEDLRPPHPNPAETESEVLQGTPP